MAGESRGDRIRSAVHEALVAHDRELLERGLRSVTLRLLINPNNGQLREVSFQKESVHDLS